MELPNDPMILLSFINTKLRDRYPDLDRLCSALCADRKAIEEKLATIGYTYDPELNKFV